MLTEETFRFGFYDLRRHASPSKNDRFTAPGERGHQSRRHTISRPSVRLGDDALMQDCSVNSPIARKVDDARGNNFATALIACENVEIGTGLLKCR